MFGKKYKIIDLFGLEVGVDASWIILAILIAWSLSTGFFPVQFQNLSSQSYWLMGIMGALGLFLSIIIHELAHSLVARRKGIPMKGITLFIFGGVAQMDDEPSRPGEEFWMAAAGPASSFLISLLFYGFYKVGLWIGLPITLFGVSEYLGMINLLLVAFNLVPAFPLDGGRILRSMLWKWKGDLKWATRISAQIGQIFGVFLIGVGILKMMSGFLIGGMWFILIGMFLQNAAGSAYRELLTRKALEGEPIQRFMTTGAVTVEPNLSLQELINEYIFRYHHKMLPVISEGRLMGCVSMEQIKSVPREDWQIRKVGDILTPCTNDNTIDLESDAVQALIRMRANNSSRLIVIDKDQRLVGIIALKDLLEFLSTKIDLGAA